MQKVLYNNAGRITEIDLSIAAGGEYYEIWSPDAPPASPSIYDDEFTDGSLNAELWATLNPDSDSVFAETDQGLTITQTPRGSNTSHYNGTYMTIPDGDFTITTKVSIASRRGAYAMGGLGLYEDGADSSKKIALIMLQISTAGSIKVGTVTNYTASVSELNENTNLHDTMYYIRIRRNSTTYTYEFSSDGIAFQRLYSGTLAFTPAHFGILNNVQNYNSAQPDACKMTYRFFRYKNSDVGVTGTLEGNNIKFGTVNVGNPDPTLVVMHSLADAKGDIIAATGADTFVKKTVGTNGQCLSADSTQTDGLLWKDVVAGIASSTDNAVVRWDGTTGKLVQVSSAIIDDNGCMSLTSIANNPLTLYNYSDSWDAVILGYRALGSSVSPSTLTNNSSITGINAYGYDGTSFSYQAGIFITTTQDWTSSAKGCCINFTNTPNDSTTRYYRMCIDHNGNIGIGTTSPDYKLQVNGTIAPEADAQDLGVTGTLRWDVFANSLAHEGSTLGFFNTAVTTKQTVTGSRGSNEALASLLTALATYGLITDSSS